MTLHDTTHYLAPAEYAGGNNQEERSVGTRRSPEVAPMSKKASLAPEAMPGVMEEEEG